MSVNWIPLAVSETRSKLNTSSVNDAMITPARPVPLDLSAAFARFRNADPKRLHLRPTVITSGRTSRGTPISRPGTTPHAWPTTSGSTCSIRSGAKSVPPSRATLGSPIPRRRATAPNTHEFVSRLLSCCPTERSPRLLTTDGEFHSFRRQSERLAEEGLIVLCAVPAEPFAMLAEDWPRPPASWRRTLSM